MFDQLFFPDCRPSQIGCLQSGRPLVFFGSARYHFHFGAFARDLIEQR